MLSSLHPEEMKMWKAGVWHHGFVTARIYGYAQPEMRQIASAEMLLMYCYDHSLLGVWTLFSC